MSDFEKTIREAIRFQDILIENLAREFGIVGEEFQSLKDKTINDLMLERSKKQ